MKGIRNSGLSLLTLFLGLTTCFSVLAVDCKLFVQNTPFGDFDIECEKNAEVFLVDGVIVIPKECVNTNPNENTDPYNLLIPQYQLAKIGFNGDGFGGADAWQESRTGSTMRYKCMGTR